MPIVSSHAQVIAPPYILVPVIWSACGLEAIILAFIAGIYIVGELAGGIDYVVIGTYPSKKAQEVKSKDRIPQQVKETEVPYPSELEPQETPSLPPWTEKDERISQELENSISPNTKSSSETPKKGSWEKFSEQLIRWEDAGILVGALTILIVNTFRASEEEAHEDALKFTEDLMRVRKLIKSSNKLTSHHNFPDMRTKEEKERENAIELAKKVAEMTVQLWQKYQRIQQKQKENS